MAGTTMQQRRGTAAQWSTANPILKAGELGFATDTGVEKLGDGVNPWNSLPVHQDSILFRSATDLATPSALMRRDANGRTSVADPTAAGHAANKGYADALGTAAATGDTIMRRDANGRTSVADPTAAGHAATKGYADGVGRELANYQTTGYTLVLTDERKLIQMNAATALTLTVPPNSVVAFPIGSVVDVQRLGTGSVSIAPGAGVSLRSPDGNLVLRGQFSTVRLLKTGTDTWEVSQDITSTTDAAVTAATSAPTVSTLAKRDAAGRFQAVSPSASADVAIKSYVDGLATIAGASRVVPGIQGSGTVFPTTNLKTGDIYQRTDIGTNGSLWTYTGNTSVGVSGWIVVGDIVICTSTTRPAAAVAYTGLKIYETDTKLIWYYIDSTYTWAPLNPAGIYGKLWATTNGSAPVSTYTTIAMGGSRLYGGFTYDAANQALVVPFDGFYEATQHGYLFGAGANTSVAEGMWLMTRIRASVGNIDFNAFTMTKGAQDHMESSYDPMVPLKAGDKIKQQVYTYASGLSYAQNAESNGTYIALQYKGPLLGATPI